jgi:hypothetical protein
MPYDPIFMTPLRNDPQQHQREAKHRHVRDSRTPDLSLDSDSARKALQKSGFGSYFGQQNCDFASRRGGPLPESFGCRLEYVPRWSGETGAGTPRRAKWTRALPSRIKYITLPRNPIRNRYGKQPATHATQILKDASSKSGGQGDATNV